MAQPSCADSDIGIITLWRLEVRSLTRAEANFSTDGVPFSLILSIDLFRRGGRQPVQSLLCRGLLQKPGGLRRLENNRIRAALLRLLR
jgi:hypothetical protein